MELPEKQGLKHSRIYIHIYIGIVTVELPEKQGLKQNKYITKPQADKSYSGTSRKTRIETTPPF